MNAAAPKPVRSPSYPVAPLGEAIGQVRKIEQLYRSSPVDRVVAAKLIGYSSLSGPANKALAALAQYGLVERAGKGEMRVTSRAQAILHPNSDTEQREQIRAAALEPNLYRELRDRFLGIPIPPEDGVITYLNRQGFNQTAIRPAAKAFLQTMRFLEEAGVSDSHGSAAPEGPDLGKPDGDGSAIIYGGARIGDMIDWEANGVLCNPEKLRVRAVSDDSMWVFVDGSTTGIPMEQTIVRERPEAAGGRFPPSLALDQAFGFAPLTPPSNDGPLEVKLENMRSVIVSGRTGSPEELQSFIDDLLDLKSLLAKRAEKEARLITPKTD